MTETGPGSSRRWWRYTIALAVVALLCAVLLGGLSAWFLGSVALAGLTAAALTFNFHIPGALIRLLAIGRTAARYGERLAGHRAALTDQIEHRVRLFASMAQAPALRRAGWQFGDQATLTDYVDDVEDVDFSRLRAGIPTFTGAVGVALGLAATAWVAPLALPPILAMLAASMLAARSLAHADAVWTRSRTLRREGAGTLGSALTSVVPLKAEGLWGPLSHEAIETLSRADRDYAALRRRQASVDALASLLGPLSALGVVAAAWLAGGRGAALLLPVFVAFGWLALGEAAAGLSRIPVAWLRRRTASRELGRWGSASPPADGSCEPHGAPQALRHPGLQRLAPDGRGLGRPLPIILEVGRPTVLVGASGSGKTSLLKQIAGWIGEDPMETRGGRLDAAPRMALSVLCLHDAAILADTVRANLFAGTRADEDLWAALAAVELTDRIIEAGGLDGWVTQSTLSLGEAQRLNLARVLLSDRPIVLLDEPTEHLDADQGRRILDAMVGRLADRILVLSSHTVGGLPQGRTIVL
ncbi:MAG: ATP-binding cassette domain-containing protein [Rhizobiaceae bacterium]|nr:ATP-binding cassette domain-containing protein [Rhizobiaceae bacterium]